MKECICDICKKTLYTTEDNANRSTYLVCRHCGAQYKTSITLSSEWVASQIKLYKQDIEELKKEIRELKYNRWTLDSHKYHHK